MSLWDAIGGLFGASDTPTPVQLGGPIDPNAIQGGAGSNMTQAAPFDITKVIGSAAPAIGSIMALAGAGGGSSLDKTMKRFGNVSGPLQSAGNQALGAYTSGTLTGPQSAAVDQFKKQNLAKWRDYLAKAGIPESSAMADIEAKVNQDAQVYSNQLLQQDFTNAVNATGMAGTNLAQLAAFQMRQDEDQREAWASFMEAMGKLGTDVGPMIFGSNP